MSVLVDLVTVHNKIDIGRQKRDVAVLLSPKEFERLRGLNISDFEQYCDRIGRVVEKVNIIRSIQICRDPKDNKFLELAIAGRAGYIITGDQDLLTLHSFHSIEIITPQDYLAGGWLVNYEDYYCKIPDL